MHVKSYEEDMMRFPEYRMHKHLVLYVPPVLLTLGMIGNVVSYVILRRKSMRRVSTYFYLAVLSLADILVLCVGLLRLWIDALTGYDPVNSSDWLCKITTALGYTASDFSVWCIIAVTVERYIVVRYPLSARSMCNTRRAMFCMLGLFVFFLAANVHFFWTVNIITINVTGNVDAANGTSTVEVPMCNSKDFKFLVEEVWPWVDAFLYSFIPFVVISVLNIMIISIVYTAQRGRSEMQLGKFRETRRNSGNPAGSIKLTFMLLCVSFTFLITTLPMNIASIAAFFFNGYRDDLSMLSKFNLARTITELLMYTNHSMNFFLYCATGQKFRREIIRIVCHMRSGSNLSATDVKCVIKESCQGQTLVTNGAQTSAEMKTYVKYSPVDQ